MRRETHTSYATVLSVVYIFLGLFRNFLLMMMMMMNQDGVVSSSNTIAKCEEDLTDDANWFKDDMAGWLAHYEQSEQDKKKNRKQWQ